MSHGGPSYLRMHLLPRDDHSIDELRQHAALLTRALPHVDSLLAGQDVDIHVEEMRAIEREGDWRLGRVRHLLRDTFITPLDRDGLLGLAYRLDDVLDALDAVAFRLSYYRATAPERTHELASTMRAAVTAVVDAIALLPDEKQREPLRAKCDEIGRLARVSSEQLRRALTELFAVERPAAVLIQSKDVYELFEAVTDRAWEVAEALEGLLLDA